ncbi:RHS repeat-associated core domain-containing protein, partial [Cognatiyoonia sp. IB215182]|uniref:RHS repeat-associated core domain-containing protein n=1 Tax=Cognatiyoonia sp. IB215182 TaxID=3097353 RepID=UPI002A0E45D2
ANGNMLTGLHGKVMTYDNENRPLSVTHNGVETRYVYGADGSRLKLISEADTANESETLYVGPIEVRNYGQANASLVAYPHPNVRLVDGVESYLHRDQLNSVVVISDASGAKAYEENFLPFGLSAVSQTYNPAVAEDAKGFIGERFDSDAGLQYLNARYYDPELGLFLQPDWFEVTEPGVGTNRYSYSFNDPVNSFDPGGNACLPCGWGVIELAKWAGAAAIGAFGLEHAISEIRRNDIPASDRNVSRQDNGGPRLDPLPPPGPVDVVTMLAATGYLASQDKVSELGADPNKGFDPMEAAHGVRYEEAFGVQLTRSSDVGADFVITDTGQTVDAMGPFPSEHFSINSVTRSLDHHLRKSVDRVSIDGTGLTRAQKDALRENINARTRDERDRIDVIGLD